MRQSLVGGVLSSPRVLPASDRSQPRLKHGLNTETEVVKIDYIRPARPERKSCWNWCRPAYDPAVPPSSARSHRIPLTNTSSRGIFCQPSERRAHASYDFHCEGQGPAGLPSYLKLFSTEGVSRGNCNRSIFFA